MGSICLEYMSALKPDHYNVAIEIPFFKFILALAHEKRLVSGRKIREMRPAEQLE